MDNRAKKKNTSKSQKEQAKKRTRLARAKTTNPAAQPKSEEDDYMAEAIMLNIRSEDCCGDGSLEGGKEAEPQMLECEDEDWTFSPLVHVTAEITEPWSRRFVQSVHSTFMSYISAGFIPATTLAAGSCT